MFRKLEKKLRRVWPSLKRKCERRTIGPNKKIALIEAIDENPHIDQKAPARELQNKLVICLPYYS
jgi:hypothetical protein